MKRHFIILFSLFSYVSLANEPLNLNPKKPSNSDEEYHKINFCFTWFGVGAGIPFNEKKLQKLPYGMNSYLDKPKIAEAAELFGFGFYYKNHWGITAIYSVQDYTAPDKAFRSYINSQFPGYIITNKLGFAQSYSFNRIYYRLSYRFSKVNYVFEPQIQLGINDFDGGEPHLVLKQSGSNQFIEYDISKQNNKKNIYSYHAALKVIRRIKTGSQNWNVEPGLRFDFMVVPTNFKYTITSTPYNMPATINYVNVKQMHPTLSITAFLSFFRK